MDNNNKSDLTQNDILKFNEILGESKDMNFMKLCERVNMAKSTLQSRLKKVGFKYDKEQSKIIQLNEARVTENITVSENKAPEEKKEPKDDINILEEIEHLKRRVQALEKERHTTIPNLEITIDTTEKINYKTVKLYPTVEKSFNELCDKYKHISKQDLLNQAIASFIEQHK